MQTKWTWFERNFNFEFPPEKMPEVVERLHGTVGRIATLLDDVSDEVLMFRESQESWSIKGNVGHLADLETLWIGRVADTMAGEIELRTADLTNAGTTAANHDLQSLETLIGKFKSLREGLLNTVQDLDPKSWSLSGLHPRLKTPMRIVDQCSFVADHDDYHLARMRYLVRTFSKCSNL